MIIREKEPANLEMPFGLLDGFITPNEQFYIRSHFPVPEVDLKTWRLKIEGAVEQARSWTHDELQELPAKTIPATLECAGNSRVFLVPKVKGTQWELGAVGNAEWTGVSLGELLRQAGVKSGAIEVILEGADSGAIAEPPRPAGKIHFARSIPLGKAMDDVLLAFRDERSAPDAGARISAARDCAGLVRNGGGKMAAAHRGHGPPVQRLLSDGRLRFLGEGRRPARPWCRSRRCR